MGAAFADALAERGLNVVLLARRQAVLDDVAASIRQRYGVETRTLAIDLAVSGAAASVIDATADLEVGFLVYCAGADPPDFTPFLSNSIAAAETMVQRNCVVPMQLSHHYAAPPWSSGGRGGIVVFGSGAGFVGGPPNMVAYGASKAFDMVFAEALWSELHDKGVDVIGSSSARPTHLRCASSNTNAAHSRPRTRCRPTRYPSGGTSCPRRSPT